MAEVRLLSWWIFQCQDFFCYQFGKCRKIHQRCENECVDDSRQMDVTSCPYLLGKWLLPQNLGSLQPYCFAGIVYIANVIKCFQQTSTGCSHLTLDLGKKPSTCKMFGKNPARHERQSNFQSTSNSNGPNDIH